MTEGCKYKIVLERNASDEDFSVSFTGDSLHWVLAYALTSVERTHEYRTDQIVSRMIEELYHMEVFRCMDNGIMSGHGKAVDSLIEAAKKIVKIWSLHDEKMRSK